MAGAMKWDINFFVREFPQRGEEMPILRITRVLGGKVGNVALATTRLVGPDKVRIIGALARGDSRQTNTACQQRGSQHFCDLQQS